MPYLIDSDWAIGALAGRRQVLRVLDHLAVQRISVSIITAGEVYEGAFISSNRGARLARYRGFLSLFNVLPVNDDIMELFAETRSFLRRQGQLIPDMDLLIGVTAVHHDLTLLTFNVRHFARIPAIRLYGAGPHASA